uniref:FBA_2 domain-containing protein n=1 Tax=Caenorhabditis tropicalis TaxID=1561998 RepID=A0A1I7UST5_9PELO
MCRLYNKPLLRREFFVSSKFEAIFVDLNQFFIIFLFYVSGGAANTAALFDFDGVYILDGGFADKSRGFVANVREVLAVLLSAPTLGNLGTTAALLEKDKSFPVFTNTKPLKAAKPGTKGILSLYILAGDAKDAEVITKALASGNKEEVERAAAAHGTVGVLLWRPEQTGKQAVQVRIFGTCTFSRIQQALDKAAKALPFLNSPSVKSKDALAAAPAPAAPKLSTASSGRPAPGKPASRPTTSGPSRPASSTIAARPLTSRAPVPNGSARPSAKPAAPAPKAAPPAAARPARSATTKAPVAAKAPVKAAAPARAPFRPTSTKSSEPVAQKKTVGKVQGAAPMKAAPAPIKKAPTPTPEAVIPAAATTARVPVPETTPSDANVTIVLDDSEITPEDLNQGSAPGPMDIVVIPPTPEPPRQEVVADEPKEEVKEEPKKEPKEEPKPEPVEAPKSPDVVEDVIPKPVDVFKKAEPSPIDEKPGDVEDVVPTPIDAFKKPEPSPSPEPVTPAYPKIGDDLDDFDPLKPSHPNHLLQLFHTIISYKSYFCRSNIYLALDLDPDRVSRRKEVTRVAKRGQYLLTDTDEEPFPNQFFLLVTRIFRTVPPRSLSINCSLGYLDQLRVPNLFTVLVSRRTLYRSYYFFTRVLVLEDLVETVEEDGYLDLQVVLRDGRRIDFPTLTLLNKCRQLEIIQTSLLTADWNRFFLNWRNGNGSRLTRFRLIAPGGFEDINEVLNGIIDPTSIIEQNGKNYFVVDREKEASVLLNFSHTSIAFSIPAESSH